MFEEKFNSVVDFMAHFNTEEKCIEHLKALRWQDGITCPHCGNLKTYQYKDKKLYQCAKCRKQFNIRTGTIFYTSNVSMVKWYIAIYLIMANRKGMLLAQLSEQLGVTKDTARSMDHRIRQAFLDGTIQARGTYEVDETYEGI